MQRPNCRGARGGACTPDRPKVQIINFKKIIEIIILRTMPLKIRHIYKKNVTSVYNFESILFCFSPRLIILPSYATAFMYFLGHHFSLFQLIYSQNNLIHKTIQTKETIEKAQRFIKENKDIVIKKIESSWLEEYEEDMSTTIMAETKKKIAKMRQLKELEVIYLSLRIPRVTSITLKLINYKILSS